VKQYIFLAGYNLGQLIFLLGLLSSGLIRDDWEGAGRTAHGHNARCQSTSLKKAKPRVLKSARK
jgi:hypothetical protein